MDHLHHDAAFETKSDPGLDEAGEGEADLVTKALESFQSAVDDRLKALETKSADAKLADRLKALETRLSRPGMGVEIKSGSDKAEIERKAFVSYLRMGEQRMPADEAKSLTLGSAPSAGYLAPPLFAGEILKYLVQFSPIRAYAAKMQISGSELFFPRRTSEVQASWVGETDPRPATSTTFEQVPLKANELACYVDVSNQLLEDNAYDLEGELALQFAESFGKTEGAAFVAGTGVGQPMGLLTSPQIASISSAKPGVVGLADIITAFHAIPSAWAQAAVWVMNRTTMASLRGINDTVGRPLLLDAISSTAPATLLGRPIVEAIDMPNVATGNTAILFGDLAGYRIVDRVGLSFLRDPYSQAAIGLTRFYARKRVGGDVTDGQRFVKLAIG